MRTLIVVALLVVGCAGTAPSAVPVTPAPTVARTPSPTPDPTPSPTPNTALLDRCTALVSPLLDALTEVDARLAVGLTYDKYGEYVQNVSVAYDKTNFDALKDLPAEDQLACLEVGSPLEDARNEFVQASAAWDKCFNAYNTSETKYNACIKKTVKTRWTTAATKITEARKALDALRP